ncbi:MAG: hypothetical protein B6226_01375 [Candidatus Cloacimonetes bacterium 4572_65]|nr:MAG: hypothetical protein B6226_01375 [Candidatus Cloacimonetes bacterium 4572_65]
MNKTLLVLVILLLCLFGLEALEYTPNQVIVKTNTRGVNFALESSPNLHSWLKGYGVKSIVPLLDRSDNNYYIISTKRDIPLNDIENKRSTFSGVDSIQPNYLNTFHGIVDDPYFLQQQHSLCNISKAWGYTTGDNDIIIAVVDSGILFEHPDLENVIYKNENEIPDNGIDDDNNGYIDDYQGWDFADAPELSTIALGDYTGRDNDASDENYHGTHVSGIIGAETNNGEGIAGVMWNVKILPIRGGFKTTSGGGYLQDDDVSSAIIYATDMGANIINMSWGDSNYSSIIADACQYAYDHGVILVGSSGNDPGPTISYPAKLSTVISVGSVDRDKGLSGFSSYGIDLDIVAPGSEVISTYSIEGDSNGYTTMSGTSMSSPYAAGIIGLLLSYRPDITFDELKTLLYATSEDLGDAGFDIFHGYGLINAENLLASVETPYIAIDYPFENMGVSSSFDIVGTIELDDFFRYSVTYTSEEIPTPLDWYDCETHVNSPEFYDEPITNGVLKRFEVEDEVPDGEYRIRISVQTNSGETYNILKHINIDKTLPYLTEDLYVEKRYRSNIVNYYLKCRFNENVNIVANFYDEDGGEYTSYSSVSDSVIYISFPENLPSGSIDVQLTATNKSGLEYNSGLIEDIGEIDYSSTPINKFSLNQFDTGMIGTKDYYDFDGNGINEFVAMSILDGGFGEVRVLEQSGDSFITKYTFADDFRALDIGNTNDYGMEILGLRLDKLFIYETYEGSNYPLDSYIQEISNAAGGIFADYNGDGEENLLCVINEAAQTVVNLYARQENEFIQRKTLYNTTETDSRNTFVPWLKCARLDSDIYPDIITADKDGDVIIFEIKPGEDDYQVWTTRIPVPNAYYIDYGDITGDGINEFIVGGYVTNQENLNSTHFQFYLFKSDSNDSYYLLDTISFDNVDSNNSLTIVDMNNDGKDEIYLSLTPYLYGIEFVDFL